MQLKQIVGVGMLLALCCYSYAGDGYVAPSSVEASRDIVGQAVLKPEKEVTIASQLEAEVDNIPYREGDSFKKGDVLMAFDCRFLEAARERSLAEKATKETEYEASLALHKLQGISEIDLARAKGAYLQSKAEDAGKALLVEQCIIHAPFAGTVTRLMARTHQFAKKGEPLIEIIDNKNLRLEVIAPSRGLSSFVVGREFTFVIDDTNKTFPAQITKVVPRIDSISKTIKIIAKVKAPPGVLLPGMSGQVFFKGQH